MKHNVLSLLLLSFAGVFSFFSCSSNDETISSSEYVKHFSVVGEDFQMESTRATYQSNLSFSWSAGDTIGIYPIGGDQVAFPISSGDGSKSAEFDGGAWGLRSTFMYAAYYPYNTLNCFVKETELPVSFIGQVQNGNDSRDDLDRYDFQAAAATAPTATGGVNLQMKHLGAFMRLYLELPEVMGVKEVTVTSDKVEFVTEGFVDLSAATPVITATKTAESLSIKLNDVTTDSSKHITVWLATAALDHSSSEFTVVAEDLANNKYEGKIAGKLALPGQGKGYTVTLAKTGTTVGGEDIDTDW